MPPDYRALCAEALNMLDAYDNGERVFWETWKARARAALAQPQPEVVGPTDEELLEQWLSSDWYNEGATLLEFRSIARAVLARWGRHAPAPAEGEVAWLVDALRNEASAAEHVHLWMTPSELRRAAALLEQCQAAPVPVAVSERLPGVGDCDAEGFCWWFSPADPSAGTFGVAACWVLRKPEPEDDFRTHWLPAHALPVPGQGEI